ncbi:hypothetical protein DUI87_06769 [Hirundo rustica rustica]|uniref:Uncharacterized protein n=1 Tax=Hirundo rustica rustica TaxID=333673 RepID=A0A3M0KT13_HIRRU|nr:hypothetical protein DUI87_06769 [Hirundo rustica rustica]
MEDHSGAEILLQPMEDPMPEQMDVFEGGCDPMENTSQEDPGRICGPLKRGAHARRGLLADPVDLWKEESMLEQVFRQDL